MSKSIFKVLALTSAALALIATQHICHAEIKEDRITSLPGWEGELPSRMWSGYIQVPGDSGSKYYHYWLVESEGNPKSDPVALWLNGGPGSSSLIGLFTENGPFELNDNSLPPGDINVCGCDAHQVNMCQRMGMECSCGVNGTHCDHGAFGACDATCSNQQKPPVPKLFHRKTGWQTQATFIFLESPAGVGFSYCDYEPCTANDTSTAVDNHLVLKGIFEGFPEYAQQEFYITGESYAGIYIPTLSEQIMNDKDNKINLKGMAVGNGCWGSKVGLCSFGSDMQRINAQFLIGVGAISRVLYSDIIKACGDPAAGPMTWPETLPPACEKVVNEMHDQAGDYQIYNYFSTCGSHGITATSRQQQIEALRAGAPFGAGQYGLGGALNDFTCGGGRAMDYWLANPEAAKALNVKSGTKGMSYGPRDRGDLRPLYKTLAEKYRVLIYSGDVDGCVPHTGTEEWTSAQGFEKTETWRPWLAGSNLNHTAKLTAGYVTNYKAGHNHNFTYLTIKGSGHMAPEFKPVPSLAMITRFFNNAPF